MGADLKANHALARHCANAGRRAIRACVLESKRPRFLPVCGQVRESVAPPTRESSTHAGIRPPTWRDPDSNRGHHDFQSCGPGWPEARNPWKPSGSPTARAPGRSPLFTSYCTQFRRWRRLISFFADALSGVAAGVSMEELSSAPQNPKRRAGGLAKVQLSRSISPISAARPDTSPVKGSPLCAGRSTRPPRPRAGPAAPTAPTTTKPPSGSAATAPASPSHANCSSAASRPCANSATRRCSPADRSGGRCARSPHSHRCPAGRSPHAAAATRRWTASKDRAAATRHRAGTPHQASRHRPRTQGRGPR
jgi:hypothetical protein